MPAFEIGLWNAWVLQVLFFLTLIVPNILLSEEGKERTKRATESVPYRRTQKIMAYSTHIFIMPFTALYSIFLPLKIGTAWLYVGLVIFALALAMSVVTSVNYATTPWVSLLQRGVPNFKTPYIFYRLLAVHRHRHSQRVLGYSPLCHIMDSPVAPCVAV
jgi:hypothetical protein